MGIATLIDTLRAWLWELGGIAAAVELGVENAAPCPARNPSPETLPCPASCPSSSRSPLSR